MQLLQTYPTCSECLIKLARDAAVLAGGENPRLALQAEATARRILEENRDRGLSSPSLANLILREIREASGVSDPYSEFKLREMATAGEISSRLKGNVREDLFSRVSLAALGNSLDFFNNPDETLVGIPEELGRGIRFSRDDTQRLAVFLSQRPALVLYLTDNSGEIYFDRPLFNYVRDRSARTVLVVKGGPSLNDLTRAELRSAGLEEDFGEVADNGTDGPGIDWERVSREFVELAEEADLIISKGMANLETIYPRQLSAPVFFIFKVKCRPIQEYLKVPVGNYMALWREGGTIGKDGT